MWGIKTPVVLCRFQKHKLAFVTKCTKKLFQIFRYCSLKMTKSLKFSFFSEITFLGAFRYEGKFTFFISSQKDGSYGTQNDYILLNKILTLTRN
jgi:hypothetical protein